ncbi:hypothetical protein RRG08_045641 [Elysia crispata]|uniref:Uncharacterized protein n=1 Tax=Elysia crispata TaxID=231223 RepID=A0AAE1A662_9GAST|nr:hypothetical protein RRG08_045641 [Elysia crispata]
MLNSCAFRLSHPTFYYHSVSVENSRWDTTSETVGEKAPGRQCKQKKPQRSDARVRQHPGGLRPDGRRWMSEWPAMDMEDETYTILPELLTGRPSLGREDTASLDSLFEIIRSLTSVFLSCFALFTGLLNVVTFARMDLSQGVNQNLLLLSCFDVWVVATSISAYICSFLFKSGYYVIAGISMFRVWRIFLSMVNYPLNSSFVVTTVIALVRCLCVTMPLTFRDIVTPFRQLIIMAVGCCISISVPLYVHLYSYFYKPQVIINSSHTAMVDPRIRNSLIFDLFRTSFYYTCFIVDSFSIIILSIYLKRSSVFQAASSRAKPKSSGGKRLSAREAVKS